jgi:hypothetical protein
VWIIRVCYTTDVKKAKSKALPPVDDPAQAMIDFTRRLLNTSKAEVDALRKRQTKKRRKS